MAITAGPDTHQQPRRRIRHTRCGVLKGSDAVRKRVTAPSMTLNSSKRLRNTTARPEVDRDAKLEDAGGLQLEVSTPEGGTAATVEPNAVSMEDRYREILRTRRLTTVDSISETLSEIERVLMEGIVEQPVQHVQTVLDSCTIAPLVVYKPDRKVKVMPPERVFRLGGALYNVLVLDRHGVQNVDVGVLVPDGYFCEDDEMEYLEARAAYVGVMAKALAKFGPRYTLLNGQLDKPAVVLEREAGVGRMRRLRVRILPVVSVQMATRVGRRLRDSPYSQSLATQDAESCAAPRVIEQAVKGVPHFQDTLALLKVWLNNHDLPLITGVTGFIVTLLLAHGLESSAVHKHGTCLQTVRSFLRWVSMLDWSVPMLLGTTRQEVSVESETGDSAFVISADGLANVVSFVSLNGMKYFQRECKVAVEMLEKADGLDFEALFQNSADLLAAKFDLLLEVPALDRHERLHKDQVLADFPSLTAYLQRAVPRLLRKGLTDRVNFLFALSISAQDFDTPVDPRSSRSFLVALTLDQAEAFRDVEIGPSAEGDSQQLNFFRRLWGSKAEPRRFKLHGIRESVLFEPDVRRLHAGVGIVVDMCQYLCKRQFGCDLVPVRYLPTDIRTMLGTSDFVRAQELFDDLATALRSLDDLPLRILEVLPASGRLRYSSITSPLSSSYPAIEIVLRTETSDKWPENVYANRTLILGILAKLQKHPRLSSYTNKRLGMDRDIPSFVQFSHKPRDAFREALHPISTAFLDVVVTRSVTFRCRMTCTKLQESLVRQVIVGSLKQELPGTVLRDLQSLQEELKVHVFAPVHTNFIKNMCQIHPMLSATIRLFKFYLAKAMIPLRTVHQNLRYGISEEMLEMLCAHVFTQTHPHGAPPLSPESGLLRVMELFLNYPFESEALHVEGAEAVDVVANVIPPSRCGSAPFKTPSARLKDSFGTRSTHTALIRCGFNPDGSWWDDPLPPWLRRQLQPEVEKALGNDTATQAVIFNAARAVVRTQLDQFRAGVPLSECPAIPFDVAVPMDVTPRIARELPGFELWAVIVDTFSRQFGDRAVFFYDCYDFTELCLVWRPGTTEEEKRVIEESISRLG